VAEPLKKFIVWVLGFVKFLEKMVQVFEVVPRQVSPPILNAAFFIGDLLNFFGIEGSITLFGALAW